MGNDKRPPNYKGGHKAKGCAVVALAMAGGVLAVASGVVYGAFEAVRMVF
jgi:hypothetical protein